MTAERCEIEWLAVERRADDRGRHRAQRDQARLVRRRRAAQKGPQLDKGEGGEDGRNEPEQDEPTLPVQLESRDEPAYLTVSVPVIAGIGWMEQM